MKTRQSKKDQQSSGLVDYDGNEIILSKSVHTHSRRGNCISILLISWYHVASFDSEYSHWLTQVASDELLSISAGEIKSVIKEMENSATGIDLMKVDYLGSQDSESFN